MNFNGVKLVTIALLISFVVFGFASAFADTNPAAKSAPAGMINKYHPISLLTTDFLAESFESWYPAGWDQIVTNRNFTWYQSTYAPYDGVANAEIVYDPALVPQNEWMISPVIDLAGTSELSLDFWFLTSYYWHVDPYNNGDMEVRVSTNGGTTWSDPLWTEDDYGVFDNWTWYNITLDFSEYAGETNFKFALVYEGTDGAQADFDAVLLSGEQQLDHDVAAIEFLSPDQLGDAGVPIAPQVRFRNNGVNTETFSVNLTIVVNAGQVYTQNVAVNALPGNGGVRDVTFPSYTPVLQNTYTLTATATLAGDQSPANNTISMDYITIPMTIYNFDFEDGNGDFSGDGDWQYGEPTTGPGGAHSGEYLWGTLINGQYTVGPLLSTLISPEMEIGDDGVFTFWHWYATENTFDGGNVKISINGGSTWTLLTPQDGYSGVLSTSYENPIGGQEAFYGASAGWEQETFDLASYAGETIMIKFDFGSDNSVIGGDGWYIDDFVIVSYGPTGIEDGQAALPTTMKLDQNYPNPFNAKTSISFSLANETQVDLTVFNLLGEKVATLVSGKMAAGTHSINWDASDVGSGVYFYKLTAEGKTQTRTLTLLK